jgi:hypothetical protein
VLIDDPEILSMDADKVRCRFTGTVDVTLVAGGRHDTIEFNESFPFECTTVAPATEPENFDPDETEASVDTSSWTGPDD